ncbi:MAG: cupin domain-containing protein [Rhodocyclaceae bacterium]|nr:cupin domain-containing protein [Rhodocyclaceae bacterium]
MIEQLLGGLGISRFLEEYWQKKPLLVRGAVPGFQGLLDRDGLLQLACRDDVESRFVSRVGGRWGLEHGPFEMARFRKARKPWTALVQGVNLVLPEGDRLMRAFDFIPYARLDDLMVSYATDGGGVGPHIDNYDVFLIQGMGTRRWRVGHQRNQELVEDLPLRILKDFRPRHDWLVEPGDLLYLPPGWAHDGVAVGECMSYSVGFRTAPAQELAEGFLTFLQDRLCLSGRYADPDLKAAKRPAEIGAEMVDQVAGMLDAIRWNRETVKDFLGSALSEPKPHVFFDHPVRPLSAERFAASIAARGLRLDLRTRLLYAGTRFYINGEAAEVPAADRARLRALADRRRLPAGESWSEAGRTLLHDWYLCGFLHPGS